MNRSILWRKFSSNWRIGFVILVIVLMFYAILKMALSGTQTVIDGKADLSEALLDSNKTVVLNGMWEFYWDQFLVPEDFDGQQLPQIDDFMKVPGAWLAKADGEEGYPNHGVATYRVQIIYPPTIQNPALRIQNIAAAYKLYANGQLIREVGKASDKLSEYKEDEQSIIVELPKETQEVELIFQVANLNFARGGLRESPVFGSREALTQQKTRHLAVQLLFIGSVFIFGLYYLLLFLLQTKNKTALFFSLLCFRTAVRSLIFGTAPVEVLFPYVSFYTRLFINYLTGFNLMPILALFVLSLYPLASKKSIWALIIIPTLIFNILLMTPPAFMSYSISYLYVLLIIQMFYIMYILIKAVLLKKDNAIIVYITICVFFLTIIQDILYYSGIGSGGTAYMALFGNFAVVIAMSFVQAKKQAKTHKRLVSYNEKLIEADRLKDKVMATEMSFLHAQIKPHFLYNALDAIANVCEKDGKKAANLIIDLAVYLRGSLEFNNLEKMTTIEKELEFVDTYFNIEQARFGSKIQLVKEIESSLNEKIPVLILQPLVENAVRHGISKKPGGGRVWLSIEENDDGLYIEVKDDGVGIGEKKRDMILMGDRLDQGVGLLNIHHRLQRLYGSGLEVSSEEGSGTRVKFIIKNRMKLIGGKQSC